MFLKQRYSYELTAGEGGGCSEYVGTKRGVERNLFAGGFCRDGGVFLCSPQKRYSRGAGVHESTETQVSPYQGHVESIINGSTQKKTAPTDHFVGIPSGGGREMCGMCEQ